VGDKLVPHFWIGGPKSSQARREPLGIKFPRNCNRITVARLPGLHCLNRLLEPQEPFAQRIEASFGLVRKLEPLAGTAEQHDPKHILKRADLLTDGSGGNRELIRSSRKAEVP